MSIFKRKKEVGQSNVLTNKTVPAYLPVHGEALDTFVTPYYSYQDPEVIGKCYKDAVVSLDKLATMADHHFTGSELDHHVDAQLEHCYAIHNTEVSDHKYQCKRIIYARQTRAETLKKEISSLEKEETRLVEEIEPLKHLRRQSILRIGKRNLHLAPLVTLLAILVDAATAFSAVQTVLFGNMYALIITVLGFTLMSDGAAYKLADYINKRDDEGFTSKRIFFIVCGSLLILWIISGIGSFMLQFGSMMDVFGSINADGTFQPKETYSMAEYAITLFKSCVPVATGALCFAVALDRNSQSVDEREAKEKKLGVIRTALSEKRAELSDLNGAPDPMERDSLNRLAAEKNLESLRIGLKVRLRSLLAEKVNEPEFTQAMAENGAALVGEKHKTNNQTNNNLD